MNEEEILQKLSNLEKKLDKLLTINTKIAKCLHLLPVSEKEERDIQILQRKNLATAAKINDELNSMENKEENTNFLDINAVASASDHDIYADILGQDILGG